MSLFSRKQYKERVSLVVLLESSAVRAGIVLTPHTGSPRLIYETEQTYKTPTKDLAGRLTRMSTALTRVCERITTEALPHIVARRKGLARGSFDAIRFVYCAPWYSSKGRRVVVEHETAQTFSASYLRELIAEQGKNIIDDTHARSIEHFATGFAIDGYRIDDPTNKIGKRLSLNMFASALPTKIYTTVEEVIMRSFHAPRMTHHSLAFIACQTLAAQSTGGVRPFIFIHLSDHTTDIALFSHDALLDTATIPYGKKAFHETWSATTKRPAHEAAFRLNEGDQKIPVDPAWKSAYAETIHDMLNGRPMPDRIVLAGDITIRTSASRALQDIHAELFRQAIAVDALSAGSCGVAYDKKDSVTAISPAMCLVVLHESLEAW